MAHVQCDHCGTRSQVEAPVSDVRARLAAIERLLREGLGRAPQAEETPPATLPANVAAVKAMSWEEMQALFASLYVDEIAAVQRDGGEAVMRAKLAALSEDSRRVVRNCAVRGCRLAFAVTLQETNKSRGYDHQSTVFEDEPRAHRAP